MSDELSADVRDERGWRSWEDIRADLSDLDAMEAELADTLKPGGLLYDPPSVHRHKSAIQGLARLARDTRAFVAALPEPQEDR